MGRKRSFIWQHFAVSEHQNKENPSAKPSKVSICKYCQTKSTFANATRMLSHIANECRACPDSLKKTAANCMKEMKSTNHRKRKGYLSDSSEDEDGDVQIVSPRPLSALSSSSTSSTSGLSSASAASTSSSAGTASPGPMDRFITPTSEKTREKIDQALARAVYMTPSVPYNVFENQYWKYAISLLRSSYTPPTRYKVGTPLLNAEYDRVMGSVKSKIKAAPCLAIISDGWTNERGENVVNFIVTTPEPVFLKSITPGKNKETAAYISTEIIKVIEELISSGIDVKSIFMLITDNAANMRAAGDLVKEKYPHIVTIGCSAHMLNLLLGDIMREPSISELRKTVKLVIKQFKNHHVIGAFLHAEQKERYGGKAITLKLPPKTRWFYFVISLYSLIKNKAALQATVIEESLGISKEIRLLVLDNENFWLVVNQCYKMLVPIAKAISHVESDKACLSDIPFLTKKVSADVSGLISSSSVLSEEEKQTVNSALVERLYKCCSDVHFAANLLHPRKLGKDLDTTEKQTALLFISEQCKHLELDRGLVLANLAEFRTKTGFFSDESMWEAAAHISPATWWGGFCADQPLFSIAKRLFNAPPTSAASERNWSLFGSVHSKNKNRLTNERVQKQVAIKSNMRFSSNALPEKPKAKVKNPFGTYDTNSDSVPEKECDLDWNESELDSDYSISDSESDDSAHEDVPLRFLYLADEEVPF